MENFVKSTKKSKLEIVRDLAKESKLPKEQCAYMYDLMMYVMRKRLENGNGVYLAGIGNIGFALSKSKTSNLTGTLIPEHHRLKMSFHQSFAKYIKVASSET